jgi:hypothetical protein
MTDMILPGAIVRHPDCLDWGDGQVQTVIDRRITVNFEHRGKVVVNGDIVALEIVDTGEFD